MRKKYLYSVFLLILIINIQFNPTGPIIRNEYSSKEIHSIKLSNGNSKLAEWYTIWGGPGDEYCVDIAIDSSENIYLVGNTESFGAGGSDIFILKINSSGILLWNQTWGGNESEYCGAITLDSSDNIYLAGTTYSYGAGSTDMCLIKFDSNGNYLWNTTWGGVDSEYCRDLEFDESGEIYLAGYTNSYGAGGNDMSLVKFYDDGDYIWNRTYGGSRSEGCNDLGIDLYGNFYLAGYMYPLGQPGPDIYIIKLNRDAEYQWDESWGGNDGGDCEGIEIDDVNNVYLCGNVWIDDISNSFLMKYSTLNYTQWNYTWNVFDESFCADLTLDASDFVYTTGTGIDIYTEEIKLYIYKFGYVGEVLWKCIQKVENHEIAQCIEIDSFDNLYIAGLRLHDDDIFLMKNPKSEKKEAIEGYNIFVIFIIVIPIIMIIMLKKEWRKIKNL